MREVKAVAISVETMADLIESSTLLQTEPDTKMAMNVISLKRQGCEGNLIIIQSQVGDAVLMGMKKDLHLTMPDIGLAA